MDLDLIVPGGAKVLYLLRVPICEFFPIDGQGYFRVAVKVGSYLFHADIIIYGKSNGIFRSQQDMARVVYP